MSTVTNLAKNLTDTTRAHAGRVAVRVDDAAMTYRALDEASARVAGLLHERGLKPGDRVGIMMPNVAEVPVVYYGVLRAGGVVVPMNPLLKAREVAYYLGDVRHHEADPVAGFEAALAQQPGHPGARVVQGPVGHRRVVHPHGDAAGVGSGGVRQVLGQVRHAAIVGSATWASRRSAVSSLSRVLGTPAQPDGDGGPRPGLRCTGKPRSWPT